MSEDGPGRWPVTDSDAASGVRIGYLTIYCYTRRGLDRLDALAARPGVGRWLDLGVWVLIALQVSGFALTAVAAWDAIGSAPTALNEPLNLVAIPGLNEFMPLAAAPSVIAALGIAMIVHEGGHAIACRHEGVPIQEWGVGFLGLLPMAAYVHPVEDALDTAPVRTRLRVYSIGVFHNLLVAGVAFALHLTPLTATPTEAFMAYFGWAVAGGTAPTAATVASLGLLTNLCFWVAFINVNLAVLNALPIWLLDGGHVASCALEIFDERVHGGVSHLDRSVLLHAIASLALVLLLVAVFGPWL